jgi:UDP-N-acetylglucosamine 3-dehydrogenase
MDTLNIGIVGCGGLPQRLLLPCLATIPQLRLVAACDLVEEKAREVAERYGAGFWTADWRELLSVEGLDGVIIAAPPRVHEEVGIRALEEGLHLFVEKPPAMNSGGARRLADAARDSGLKVLMGTVQRHVPVHRMMKEKIASREFGAPLLYQSRYCAPGPGMRMDWGMDRSSESQMFLFFLLDHVIHQIDLARFLMGEISVVKAARTRAIDDRYAFVASLEFENGPCGSISCSFRAPTLDNQVAIYGDGPSSIEARDWTHLVYRPPCPPIGQGGYDDSPSIQWSGGISFQEGVIRPGYREELRLWADGMLNGARCHADLEDGWLDMLVVEALHRSIMTGEAQRLLP